MSSVVLCRVAGCRTYGVHAEEHPTRIECRGCRPREAAPTLVVCSIHRDNLAEDPATVVEVYAELEYALVPAGSSSGVGVSGTKDRGLRLNPLAVDARADIESRLAWWADLIVSERGFTAPARTVPALAEFVGRNADWLAAHPSAPDAVAELREMAWGFPRRVAMPDGTRTMKISRECPECGGALRAYIRPEGSTLPSGEIVCETNKAEHRWAPHEWFGLKVAA